MDRFEWKDEDAKPFRFRIGMRMVKTAVAVFLCALTGWLRGEIPIFAVFAAVLCLQNSTGETLVNGVNRIIGTIIGGLFGVLVIWVCKVDWIEQNLLFYYLIVSFMTIPIILVTLLMKKPSVTALSCVVFLSITISQFSSGPVIEYAWARILDTLIGIVVTVFVDLVLPHHQQPAPESPQKDDLPQK